MSTITVYLEREEERERLKRRHSGVKYLLVAGVAAVSTLALQKVPEAPPPRVETRTVVQVVRVREDCPVVDPRPTERPPLRKSKRAKAPMISPLSITFRSPGWEPVAILNPYDVPIRIRDIAVRPATGELAVSGAAQCIGTLRPGEHCRLHVFATPAAIRDGAALRIDVRHGSAANPVTMLVRTVRHAARTTDESGG